jgi:predicted HTH domain antitoxin
MAEEELELIEMRCRTCGTSLGVRRRQGPFVFWCSEPCAETAMAKSEQDVISDEVAVELYLDGVGIMEISRFIETPYTRIQQLLTRRGITLSRPIKKEKARQ